MRRLTFVSLLLVGCAGSDGSETDSETDGGGLTQEAFEEAWSERFCAEWDGCNTSGTECPVGGTTTTGTATCDYDAEAAQACIDGTWSCDVEFPGFEFPVPPAECSDVCGGGTAT